MLLIIFFVVCIFFFYGRIFNQHSLHSDKIIKMKIKNTDFMQRFRADDAHGFINVCIWWIYADKNKIKNVLQSINQTKINF